MRRLHKFLALDWPDRFLVVEAALWLCLSRIALAVLPFRWVWSCAQRASHRPPGSLASDTRPQRVSWAVSTVAPIIPGGTCLPQAVTGTLMLAWRGIPSQIHIGVDKESGALQAHAWLEAGGRVILGNHGIQAYKVLTRTGP